MSVENKLDRYGFSLKSVTWGYRDMFRTIFQQLFEEEQLGPQNQDVTTSFFAFIQCTNKEFIDHLLKEFLEALSGEQKWLLSIPSLFERLLELGYELSCKKVSYGIDFFRLLKTGALGKTPSDVSHCITVSHRLMQKAVQLAHAFLRGYGYLLSRLDKHEIDRYIEYGLLMNRKNSTLAAKFLATEIQTSETYIREITKEVRLSDRKELLIRITKALSGMEIEYDTLSRLDSDELIEKGVRFVQCYRWVYLPESIRDFDSKWQNRCIYDYFSIIVSGMVVWKSFPLVHGHPEYKSCSVFRNHSMVQENMFLIIEYIRIIMSIRKHWPGTRKLLDLMLTTDKKVHPSQNQADILFFTCIGYLIPSLRFEPFRISKTVLNIVDIVENSNNFFRTVHLLDETILKRAIYDYPTIETVRLRSFACLPDFRFAVQVDVPPCESIIIQLKEDAERKDDARRTRKGMLPVPSSIHEQISVNQRSSAKGNETSSVSSNDRVGSCYLYDEWSDHENCYYADHCRLYEIHTDLDAANRIYSRETIQITTREIQTVQRLFERIKPASIKKEKFLQDGDSINPDLLVQHMVNRCVEASPEINFYEKTSVKRRDIAVILLLDISGSTAEKENGAIIMETILKSACLLGEGLSALGDTFSISGFSGTGREQCQYFVYKDFSEAWTPDVLNTLQSVQPLSGTRMGPALRHSAYRLSTIEAKTRLIVLITDGRPMDEAYDVTTYYAQYDVRRACEENKHHGIHTFCISTNKNSRADMEIMFPQKRFLILEGFSDLPSLLPKVYVRLTL